MRVSDDVLMAFAESCLPGADRAEMARELLAARKVIEAARDHGRWCSIKLSCRLCAALREYDEVSLSGREPGEPTACHTAEERGIAVATGSGRLPDDNPESTGDSAERRSPAGTPAAPAPDESNRHLRDG